MSMNKKKEVYLDYAATCPVDSRVVEVMLPYYYDKYGNSMSVHSRGRQVAEAVEKARKKLAGFIGASASEIVFTGSATESNNLALKGVMVANRKKGRHLIISAIEHDCVRQSAKWLEGHGLEVSVLSVSKDGLISIKELEGLIRSDTVMVSVMQANNEVGVIQDVASIGRLCGKKGVLFHTDAAQSFSKVEINVDKMRIDLLTVSAHKIYGPLGAAFLYVRKGVVISPLMHGGGHEGGLRSSTINVAAIVGMGRAAEIAFKEMSVEAGRIGRLRDKLIDGILEIPGSSLNGHRGKRLFNNVNVSFVGVEGESLMLELSRRKIWVSTGSACSSNSLESSHVLMAMGLGAQVAHGSLRFSLGRWTKESDIDYVLQVLKKAVVKLRSLSPVYQGTND